MNISEIPHPVDGHQIKPPPGVDKVDLSLDLRMPETKPANGNGHVIEIPEKKPEPVSLGVGDGMIYARRRAQARLGWRRRR